jgi:hypothetical protein
MEQVKKKMNSTQKEEFQFFGYTWELFFISLTILLACLDINEN